MTHWRFFSTIDLCSIALVLAFVNIGAASASVRPNLLLIIADDLGYGDLGCTGSTTISTPSIDALASQGVLCTQAYVASSVCSPSRAGLMTGRDPRRFGYEGNLNKAASGYATRAELLGLPPNEHTIANHLAAAGYSTALVGKWHLGDAELFHPNHRGFEYFCGILGGGHNYFPTANNNKIQRNGQPLKEFSSPYLTDFFTDEAIAWIKSRQTEAINDPWLMVLSYNAPHTPMQATEKDLADCQHIKDPKRRTYAAMVQAMDRGIGRVTKTLQDLGCSERTLVVFLSDNGGATSNASWNGKLSGAKGTLREGGVRVPMICAWPETLPAGKEYKGVVSSMDILPTFLGAANAQPLELSPTLGHQDATNQSRAVERYGAYDGVDLRDTLSGTTPTRRLLFWRLQGQTAVLDGNHKLIRLPHRPAQLFRPATDVGERRDLANGAPEIMLRLMQKLGEWESNLTTVPLWDSSPRWWRDSARIYDTWNPRPEPK